MHDELTPEQAFAHEAPETMIPRELSKGRTVQEIIADLVRLEWTPEAAQTMVEGIAQDFERFTASAASRAELIAEWNRLRNSALIFLVAGTIYLFIGIHDGSTIRAAAGLLGVAIGAGGLARHYFKLRRYIGYAAIHEKSRSLINH
ncbi:MAG: hypothetical protein V4710_12475 [Verrucomicrobiota bacterium]